MAKDRFSKFKKSNYNKQLKYGLDVLIEKNKSFIKRPELTLKERKRLKELLKSKVSSYDGDFIKSVLKSNKSMTISQLNVIKKIEEKLKQ